MKLIYFYLGTLCGFYSVRKPYNVQSMFKQSQMHSSGLHGVRCSGNVLLCSRYLTSDSLAHGVRFWASHGKFDRVKNLFSSILSIGIFLAAIRLRGVTHWTSGRMCLSFCSQKKKQKYEACLFSFFFILWNENLLLTERKTSQCAKKNAHPFLRFTCQRVLRILSFSELCRAWQLLISYSETYCNMKSSKEAACLHIERFYNL